jgi:formylglycine-generating enzyme required for sulfatase activity
MSELFQPGGEAPAPSRKRLWPAAIAVLVLVGGGYLGYRATRPPPAPPPEPKPVPSAPVDDDAPPLPEGSMVRVPGGTWKMGSTDGDADEKPIVDATVGSYLIDRTEVTVAAYRACVAAGKCEPPDTGAYCNWDKPGKDRHPVNCVDARQAEAFCAFADKRLPAEDEWDFAARGTDGRKYPWQEGAPAAQLCWNGPGNDLGKGNRQGTCTVGRYPAGASPFGALDMAGNVWEWTATRYCPYDHRDCEDARRVIRGGGWNNLVPEYVRAQDRSKEALKARNDNIGFRCARTGPGDGPVPSAGPLTPPKPAAK